MRKPSKRTPERVYKNFNPILGSVNFQDETGIAFTRLARWYDKVEKAGFKSFNTLAWTIRNHYQAILNYFDRRGTNASQNLSTQRSRLSGHSSEGWETSSSSFTLYRLSKTYA